MAKTVHIPNDLKSFSSHPGHGNAAKTAQQFNVLAEKMRHTNPALAEQAALAVPNTAKHFPPGSGY